MTLEDRARRAAEETYWNVIVKTEGMDLRSGFITGYLLAARVEVIEALERLVPEVCWRCGDEEPLQVTDGVHYLHSDVGFKIRCGSAPLHAEIARLNGEKLWAP
jgi:hypothetical protein